MKVYRESITSVEGKPQVVVKMDEAEALSFLEWADIEGASGPVEDLCDAIGAYKETYGL